MGLIFGQGTKSLQGAAPAAAKSLQSCPTLCDPIDGTHQAPPSLGFSRQECWSGLPFPSPMHESEKWKWSSSVMSDSSWPHGLQPTRFHPWDFPGKSTGVGCHCLLHYKAQVWPKTKQQQQQQQNPIVIVSHSFSQSGTWISSNPQPSGVLCLRVSQKAVLRFQPRLQSYLKLELEKGLLQSSITWFWQDSPLHWLLYWEP